MVQRTTLILGLVTALSAFAAETADDAKIHFKRGAELYDEGNYRAALAEFKKAHELLPNFKLLYNIAQVHMQLLDYARAQDTYARYLREGGSEVPAARQAEVQKEIDRLKTRVGQLVISGPDGAEVLLDDEPIGHLPLRGPYVANTGRHRVGLMLAGATQPVVRVVEVLGLESVTVAFPKEAAPAAASAPVSTAPATSATNVSTAPPPAEAPRSKVPMIVGWIVTGSAAVTAGVLSVVALGAADQLKRERGTYLIPQATLNATQSRLVGFAAAADVLWLTTIVGAGISTILTITALTGPTTVAIGPGSVSFSTQF